MARGYAADAPTVSIRTSMDLGPAKVRQRITNNVRPIKCQLTLTKVQVDTLDTFYETTCAGGSSQFTWRVLQTGATVVAANFRFVSPPKYSGQLYQSISGGAGLYTVSLDLEQMP